MNYGEMKLGQGSEASRRYLKENPKLVEEISQKIKEASAKEESQADKPIAE